jgi:hypothetical protein
VKPPGRPTTSGLRAGIRQGLRGGTAALGWTVLAAQIYSFIIYFVAGRPFRPWSFVKIGWLFLLSFSRVGLRLKVGGVLGTLVTGASTGELTYTVHLAFLTGTALACWLLFRAGRRAGRVCGEALLNRAVAGAAVAVPYAAFACLGSLVAVVRFPDQGVPMVSSVTWEAFVLPLVMAGVSGVAGALLGGSTRGRVALSIVGGWRAFVTALVLSLAGLLVLGAIYPGGTASYARWLSNHGHLGPLAFALQLLSLPNHATFILVPAMGGCDTLGAGMHALKIYCTGSYALPHMVDSLAVFLGATPLASDVSSTAWPFWLLLAVPLPATVAGARWVARGEEGHAGRVLVGLGTGFAFAVAVTFASWVAGVALLVPARAGSRPTTMWLGPALGQSAMLSLAWGLLGGAVGGLTARWRQEGGSPVPDPGAAESGAPPPGDELVGPEDRPDPPSPTSV